MFEENILRKVLFAESILQLLSIEFHLEENSNSPYWSNYNQFLNRSTILLLKFNTT